MDSHGLRPFRTRRIRTTLASGKNSSDGNGGPELRGRGEYRQEISAAEEEIERVDIIGERNASRLLTLRCAAFFHGSRELRGFAARHGDGTPVGGGEMLRQEDDLPDVTR